MISFASGADWATRRVADCCEVVSGATPRRDKVEYWGGDVPWVTPKDLKDLRTPVIRETPEHITTAGFNSCSTRLLPVGSILFSSRAPIGHTAVTGVPMCTNQGFKSLIPADWVDPHYLYRCMSYLKPAIVIQGRGATFKEISKGIMEAVEIPLPCPDDRARSLAEQKRIATILDKADAIRCKRLDAPIITRAAARDYFIHEFGDPVSNTNGYDTAQISDVATVITGNTPPRSNKANYGDHLEWIKSDNINTPYHYATVSTEHLSDIGEQLARTAPIGATLVTCIAGSHSCIGNAALTDRVVAFNQQINAVVPGKQLLSEFLYSMILALKPAIQKLSSKAMKGMVSKGRFETLQVIVPPLQQQKDFVRRFIILSNLALKADTGAKEANDLFNSLVQRAFQGNL